MNDHQAAQKSLKIVKDNLKHTHKQLERYMDGTRNKLQKLVNILWKVREDFASTK